MCLEVSLYTSQSHTYEIISYNFILSSYTYTPIIKQQETLWKYILFWESLQFMNLIPTEKAEVHISWLGSSRSEFQWLLKYL